MVHVAMSRTLLVSEAEVLAVMFEVISASFKLLFGNVATIIIGHGDGVRETLTW